MKQDNKKTKNKQSYERPKLRIIELSADEVLGVPCKIAPGHPSGVGGTPNNCTDNVCVIDVGS
jgi:hypothetical protein